ncbi:MAG: restriction endonuclease subunit S [Candidatus Thiodiazotropha sp. (ex Lucinoma borealis)]|nr:restriction endonuclease subunit S [Candidatus Thiodiazotropha sp. (ex Lucinoma borealis)]
MPSYWYEVEIGDVADVVAGGTPKAGDKSNFAEPGTSIAWLTPADLSGYKQKYISHGSRDLSQKGLDLSSAKLMPEGALLFSSRAPIGYVAIAANPISTNQGFKNFIFTDCVDSSFAYYYLRSIRGLAESRGTGTTFKEISGATAKKLPFILVPLAEQKQIAAKLDELLAQVDTLKTRLDAIPAILKRFRQSVLAAAVSGRLTEEWRETAVITCSTKDLLDEIEKRRLVAWNKECERVGRKRKYKGPAEGDMDELHRIPSSWAWASVDRLSSKVVDGVHKKPQYQSNGVPFVTVKNLTAGSGISFDNVNYISEEDHSEYYKRANPETGDILISKDGTLGVVRQIRTNIEFSIFVSVALVKPVYTDMSDYLELAFSSLPVQAQMVGVGTGLQHIHLTDLRQDMIPVPPLEEQTEIVRRVEQLFTFADQIEQRVIIAQSRVNHLTQSILAKAFRGELTAEWREQNADLITGENSAESLLESIKAKLVKMKPVKQGRARKKVST